jgi:two-component system, OmpR family, response regulator CpxR
MRNKTVLLVEDDLEIRDILQDVLEAEGFDVFPASNGKQALDFLTLNQPQHADLVILDLMMPMISGWQVLEKMNKDPSLSAIPVMVLSAVARDKPAGAAAFLRKPFDIDTFCDAVRGHFSRPEASRPD